MSTETLTPVTTGRGRVALLSALLALGAVVVAAMVLWQPWGERDAFSYSDLAPNRDAGWLGSVLDGLALGVVGVTAGLVVCLLVPARGAAWATVGALLTGLGGVAFAAGIVAAGTVFWYATEPAAIPADAGTALLSFAEDNPGHLMGLQMAGFLLFTIGSLVLMAALWRARSVPRWLPVAFLVLTVGVFALGGVALDVVQAAQMLVLAAPAWYLLKA
ncbi:hypothetical protein [Virgisporangium ochraceum]|uniref:DUF4386 family protein n=1 Tax=Virgisporangium ochraceum TaxID=65505 RepID=A0A8J4EG65_9ACTN|nr:hypothetical protein [Virgisporangium ochraceum]GIJ73436.1 hypothetical protein Voc01_083530 [Virgisporangium ochraceum]